MLETAHNQVTAKLEVSIGISSHPDPDIAIGEAAGSAGHRLGATVVDFAMVITAGPAARDAGGSPVYGRASRTPLASVACVEAPYASGIGYTDASPADGVEPSPETLVHGAADAMLTAVKRLEGRPARLVVVIESAERHRKLGA